MERASIFHDKSVLFRDAYQRYGGKIIFPVREQERDREIGPRRYYIRYGNWPGARGKQNSTAKGTGRGGGGGEGGGERKDFTGKPISRS